MFFFLIIIIFLHYLTSEVRIITIGYPFPHIKFHALVDMPSIPTAYLHAYFSNLKCIIILIQLIVNLIGIISGMIVIGIIIDMW